MTTVNDPNLTQIQDQDPRKGSLFGAHGGSVRVLEGVDLIAPILADSLDAETGAEIDRLKT
jgi:hypothetical protein